MWKQLFKANIAYAVGSGANSLAMFLLIPYLIQTFSPAEYGTWVLFEVAILLLQILVLMGLDVGLMREYWFLANDTRQARLTGSILLMVLLWGGLLFGLGLVVVQTNNAGLWPANPTTLHWVMAIAWSEAVFGLFQSLFRIREMARTYVWLSVGRMFLFMGLAIGLVQAGYGLAGGLAGRLGATLLVLVIAAVVGKRYLSFRPDWPGVKRGIRYGLPLLPTNIAAYILFAADRYMLEYFVTLETVAIYSFTYKIATTLDVAITRPFATDWAPRRFKIAAAPNAPQKYAAILPLYLAVSLGFSLLVMAVAPALYQWLAPPLYGEGLGILPVILLAYILFGMSYPVNIGIMLKDRTRYLPLIGWLAAALCLGLNYWWIPDHGLAGAAWATVIAYLVWTGGIGLVSQKLYPVPYSIRQIGQIVSVALVGYGGLQVMEMLFTTPILSSLIFRLGWITVVLAVGSYWLWPRFLTDQLFAKFIRKRSSY